MKFTIAYTALFLAAFGSTHAFTTQHHAMRRTFTSPASLTPNTVLLPSARISPSRLEMAADMEMDEVERLRSMAAKLRAEAASLEAGQSQAKAAAAEKAFTKFDINQDGNISVQELKQGLEKEFKQELPEKSVQQLLANFDNSGDGALQLDEFVSVEQFRNRLDAFARDERSQAMEKLKTAKAEQAISEQLDEQLALINDKPPTGTDKLVSTLPYLFPLLDGLQFASFLVLQHQDSPLAGAVGLLYALYRSIPLGGFIAFLSLSVLSDRPGINRLVRYNMQQAIYLDIALFFPGLVAALVGLTGVQIPTEAVAVSSEAIFFTMLATVAYSMGSSLLGKTPDGIPFISDAVSKRVPTVDSIKTRSELFLKQQMGVDLSKSSSSEHVVDSKINGESLTNGEQKTKEEEREKVNKD